jgi:hypothetical protein
MNSGVKWNAYKNLLGKPEGEIPRGRPRRREDNINMDFRNTGTGVLWVGYSNELGGFIKC